MSGSNTLDRTSWQIRFMKGSTFEAWQITSPLPAFRGSYGWNQGLLETGLFGIRPMPRLGPLLRGIETYSIRGKTNVPVLLDCSRWSGSHVDFRRPPPFEGVTGLQSFCINRHNGYVNGVFLDWSVRRIGLKELWTLKWYSDFDTTNRWTRAGGVQPEDWPQWMRNFKDY
jgi:prepilin-type processing-associated H-X9-DG protein